MVDRPLSNLNSFPLALLILVTSFLLEFLLREVIITDQMMLNDYIGPADDDSYLAAQNWWRNVMYFFVPTSNLFFTIIFSAILFFFLKIFDSLSSFNTVLKAVLFSYLVVLIRDLITLFYFGFFKRKIIANEPFNFEWSSLYNTPHC